MLEIFTGSEDMAQAAADAVAEGLHQGLVARGRASLVATGGRSPGPVYDRLQQANLDWSKVGVTLSDERFVPPSAAESNAGLLAHRLFCGRPGTALFAPLWFDVATNEQSAQAAEAGVRALAPFDVVMLGMGEDGHIASLLPGDPNLDQTMALDNPKMVMAVAAGVGSPPLPRITLTLAALLQSRQILVLIAGAAKRQVIARVLAGEALPVGGVLGQDRVPVRVLWAPEHGG